MTEKNVPAESNNQAVMKSPSQESLPKKLKDSISSALANIAGE